MINEDIDLFEYAFVDHKANKTLFLLHGTGGGINDFMFLDEHLNKKYNLVGMKGNIDEGGMARFFKRLSLGVFDQESILEESEKLRKFVTAWMTVHNIKVEQLFFLGYSNGANMLLATLLQHPEILNNIILLHPMMPFLFKEGSIDLSNNQIFLSTGINDQMISLKQSLEVVKTLKGCNANIIVKEYESGHEITSHELEDVIAYLGH